MESVIYKYKNINNLGNHPEFNLIKDTLHICANTSMAEAMVKKYGNEFSAPIFPVASLTKNLLGVWDSEVVKLGQYIELTKKIKQLRISNTKYEGLLKGIRRNQKDILSSIRLLVESNIYPSDFIPKTDEEELFVKLWDLIDTHDSIAVFRNEFHCNFEDEEYFKPRFVKSLIEVIERELHTDKVKEIEKKEIQYKRWIENIKKQLPERIICHGFYFITPIQDRIFKLIQENLNIQIIFLNCYDESYPRMFEIWKKTFDSKYGFPEINQWIGNPNEDEEENWATFFSKIFQGENIKKFLPKNNLEIVEYDDVTSFINKYEEKENYYSPDAKKLNQIFREYYPEKYRQSHFLAYPIGQFLFQLHKMWDENEKDLILDMECIEQCFASGWLYNNGLQAKDYVYDLKLIEPYFKGCRRIDEWKERLDLLLNVKSEIVELFNTTIDQSNKNYRYHKMLSNPFLNFSFFKVDKLRLEQVTKFILKLIDISKELFDENKEINLEEYLQKINKILEEHYPNEALYEQERELMEELKNRLSLEVDYFKSCFPEDIAEALIIFLGGEFTDSDDDNELDEIILPISKIESAAIKNNNEVVHACQISEEVLPGGKIKLTWPLTETNLSNIQTGKRVYSKTLLERTRLIISEKKLENRYLFYCILQVDSDIKLSWIKNWEDKKLKESVYIQLLKMWNEDIKQHNENGILEIKNNKEEKELSQDKSLDFKELTMLPEEVFNEFKICPRRFFYSYIAQDFPTYISDFHHQFAFVALIKSIYCLLEKNKDYIFNEIKDIFIQWNELQKKQLLEYVSKKGINDNLDYDNFDKVYYSEIRKLTHFLRIDLYRSLDNEEVNMQEIDEDTNNILFAPKGEKKKCMYCPHIEYCSSAVYPLDKEEK